MTCVCCAESLRAIAHAHARARGQARPRNAKPATRNANDISSFDVARACAASFWRRSLLKRSLLHISTPCAPAASLTSKMSAVDPVIAHHRPRRGAALEPLVLAREPSPTRSKKARTRAVCPQDGMGHDPELARPVGPGPAGRAQSTRRPRDSTAAAPARSRPRRRHDLVDQAARPIDRPPRPDAAPP